MTTRPLDSLVARGNTSDVYRWGDNAVVKVLRPGIPDEWAMWEAQTTALVHAAGLPAPAVLDMVSVGGRPGIVFERVAGVSMWEQMLAYPGDMRRLAALLADLQAEVNATPAPHGLPRLVDRLRANIDGAALLAASERAVAHTALEHLADGDMLCHFDIHPNNVLMGPVQPILIDWFDAAAGGAVADVVRSSVLMRRDAAACHLPCDDPAVIERVHDHYLAAVAGTRDVPEHLLLEWEAPVVAARLAEPITSSMQQATLDAWRDLRAGRTSRLVRSLGSARPSP